jgi:hypothetical protein
MPSSHGGQAAISGCTAAPYLYSSDSVASGMELTSIKLCNGICSKEHETVAWEDLLTGISAVITMNFKLCLQHSKIKKD